VILNSVLPKVKQAMQPVPAVGGMARPQGTWGALAQSRDMKAQAPQSPTMPNVNPTPASPVLPMPSSPAQTSAPASPAPLPLPVQSNTAQLSRINPANDLRSIQIAPTAGPSRSQIALDRLKSFDMGQADDRQRGIQGIGRAAARLGRLNSGMVTTDLGNLEERLNRERERTLLDLSANTAEGEIGDARYDRGELRTERGFQTGQAENAIDRNVQQRLLEETLLGNEWNRNRVLADAELKLGESAGQSGSEAMDALAELIRNRAASQVPQSQQTVLDEIGQAKPPATLPTGIASGVPKSILDLLRVS
jgi:hypothetical protein